MGGVEPWKRPDLLGTLTDSNLTSCWTFSEDKTRPDYLATVDTDPASPTYSQVNISIWEFEQFTTDLMIVRFSEKLKWLEMMFGNGRGLMVHQFPFVVVEINSKQLWRDRAMIKLYLFFGGRPQHLNCDRSFLDSTFPTSEMRFTIQGNIPSVSAKKLLNLRGLRGPGFSGYRHTDTDAYSRDKTIRLS